MMTTKFNRNGKAEVFTSSALPKVVGMLAISNTSVSIVAIN